MLVTSKIILFLKVSKRLCACACYAPLGLYMQLENAVA